MTDTAGLLLLIAGARGAIGSTVALAASLLETNPQAVAPFLTTSGMLPPLPEPGPVHVAGWEIDPCSLSDALRRHGVVPPHIWQPLVERLEAAPLRPFPASAASLTQRVETLAADIEAFRARHPACAAVLVNLLPAAPEVELAHLPDTPALLATPQAALLPDLAFALAAIRCRVPLVNFTPNEIELPAVLRAAESAGVPLCGRDGKTGQTYLKVVLASALRARALRVQGWYSLNILGNSDGRNLQDPQCAAGKLRNKTDLLDELLGYPLGADAHRVHIDYYAPRGDAKEAWDVIDFDGLFGLPMSLRLNLQGRDSILAAPMVIDLARWMALLKRAGRRGAVPELSFFFKRPVGDGAAVRFQDQLASLERLAVSTREGP